MQAPSAMPHPKPLRLLHVIHGLYRGGLENGVINLLNGLPLEEFEQAVCCLDQRGEMAARITRPWPLQVIGRARYDLRAPFRLARLMRSWRPDLVHCRNWHTWADTALAHRLAGRPGRLLWSFHGFASDRFPRRRRLAARLLTHATHRRFAVCRDSAARFAAVAGLDPTSFDVLYNGVDCERFRPAADRSGLRRALGIAPTEILILTVANLTPVKAHTDLLSAAARVSAPAGQRLRWHWIGEGAERTALERRRAELGLNETVEMPGASDRVPDYLAAADLFVLPSRLEGMSNAILEAMASGLPVVARAVGGNPELIADDRCGLLVAPDAPDDLAGAIARLVQDAELRAAMGRMARQRAEREFSLAAMLARYSDYYHASATAI
jgi:sugar transferase (PEP-CTERM/EpsH1 system associated)